MNYILLITLKGLIIMAVKRILVPVDGSEPNLKAIREAKSMALKSECAIVLLHVVDVDYLLDHSILNDLKEQKARILNDAYEQFVGLNVEKYLVLGDPAEEIMKKAVEENIDLIIMAKRGLTGLKKYLIGSVSSKVVTHAEVPVLILP